MWKTEQEFDGFGGLQNTDHPRQNAKHASIRAGRNGFGRRWFGEEVTIAGSAFVVEERNLPFEAEHRAVHPGGSEQ